MSKKRESRPEEKSLLGPLNVSGLHREARAQILLAAYLAFGPEIEHQRRLRDLSSRTGMSYNALLQVSARRHWKEALSATQAPSDTAEAKEGGIVTVTAIEEVNRTFSALQMATGIKKYAQLANEVCMSFSKVTQRLVSLWAKRIDLLLDGVRDPATLSELDAMELRRLFKELAGFMESSARYISPATQAQLLSAVQFHQSLPPDIPEDVEPGAFTVASLQKLLIEEMGVQNSFEDTTRTDEVFAKYREEMEIPNIEGKR